MILQCALCHHTGLDVESRIVADESPLGYHREPRCVDTEACRERRDLVKAAIQHGAEKMLAGIVEAEQIRDRERQRGGV